MVRHPITIATALLNAAQTFGANTAYIEGDRPSTVADHFARAMFLALWLESSYGVKPGDRVAVLAQTSQAYIALCHAGLLGHFIVVPLNVRLSAPEIAQIILSSNPKVLIHDLAHAPLAAQISQISDRCMIIVEKETIPPGVAPPAPARSLHEDSAASIMYTGGTTGRPKGVVFTQRGLAAQMHRLQLVGDIFGVDTSFYATTPIFHVSGINMLIGPIISGGRTILVPTFDAAKLPADSIKYRTTHLVLIARMIDRFLDAIEDTSRQHAHIRYIGYGGAPVSEKTIGRIQRLLPNARLNQAYGMTEALGSVTLLTDADHRRGGERLRSAGRAVPGCAIVPRRSAGTPCDRGEAGELYIRVDSLMGGYWGSETDTSDAVQEGWYRSGDIGYLDSDGYLYIVDRAKDMIVTGGENVYSIEVERAIETLAGVAQVAVIGIPSEIWGEQVHAVIVPSPDTQLDFDSLLVQLRQRLAGYKCPKSVEFRTSPLPISGNNKVLKSELREPFWAGYARGVN